MVSGLGQGQRPESRQEVNANLPTWGGKLEELKADTLGFYNRHFMIENGLETSDDANRDLKMEMFATMVVGYYRSVRFGLHRSYALNAMIELNNLLDLGALEFDPKQGGRMTINPDKIPEGLKGNARAALMLQVDNNDNAVGKYYERYAVIRPETQALLDRVTSAGIPRDLYPVFPALDKLEIGN